ncbi:glycosyltransferase family 4 protein [Lamprocystis purpurea]|jgi:glycosyltransferase involved in cell wall biosynthesis|uniref:glycosyltransferase family 4 protein n=1 Tax=Lamprocystis purpurea TaxID=61598 RepID=UPI000A03BCF8|nr:glycosyltransferase family 4 protein [Lamprocystis purpurea]
MRNPVTVLPVTRIGAIILDDASRLLCFSGYPEPGSRDLRALLANKFFYRKGGAEVVMLQERAFLIEAGFDVIDFAMQDSRNLPSVYAEYFSPNRLYDQPLGAITRIGTAFSLIHSPEAVKKFEQLIEKTRPDIVHCHNIYHQLTPSIIRVAKGRNIPVVLTLHDYKPVCPTYTRLRNGQVCSDCLDNRFSNVVKHRCADGSLSKSLLLYAEAQVQRLLGSYEQVDRFIAPSEFMRSSVTRHRFPKDRVEVIYNGVDCSEISASHHDRGYALYIGRLTPEKGVETLLAAHAGIAEQVPLVVAGTGPMEDDLRARYPRAKYLGHLSGSTLENTIRDASLIVVPSEWYENCPMSILEAMAHGKAVVAGDIGGIPELVLHEKTGLLFPPGDRAALKECLTRLMADPDLRRSYGTAARSRLEAKFALEQHNSELLKLYLSVIEQYSGRASADTAEQLITHRS